MTNVKWSDELKSWAHQAGYLSTSDVNGAVLYSEGGENCYSMRVGSDHWYELTFASRGNGEKLRLRASTAAMIERYLFAALGDAIRDRLGLPFVPSPFEPDRTAPGYAVSNMTEDGYRYLMVGREDAIAAARDETRSLLILVPLSHYLSVSVAELESLLLSETGFPFPSK